MAIGKKSGGKNFKPGNKANPNGRPKLPPEVREARKLNTNEMILIFNRIMFMTESQMREHRANPETPKLEKALCAVIDLAERKGDHYAIEFMLNRTIGKVTDKVEMQLPRPTIVKRSDGTELVMGAKFDEKEDTE